MMVGSRAFVSRSVLLLLWLIALVLLVGGLGAPVVQRTQEARVLETAREMLDADWYGWMVPRLNGELRLQKPPLAYWLSACSYKVLGMNEFAGRLPFALAAWLTVGLAYRIAARLMGSRAGFLAAGATLTMFMFFRHGRLAETDVLAGMFVTLAIDQLLRGARAGISMSASILTLHLAGLGMGLAAMSKGLPAIFPLIFLLALCAVERDWKPALRFVTSGAVVTFAITAGWWFYYIWLTPDWEVVKQELAVITGGEEHAGPFYVYFPQLLASTLPWSGLVVLGIIGTIRQWRVDQVSRVLLIWFGSIFVPLCLPGNKQNHYLVPLMPCCGALVAWAVERALARGDKSAECRWVRAVFVVMLGVSIAGVAGIAVVARMERSFFTLIDLLVALIVLCAGIAAWSVYRRHGLVGGAVAYMAGMAVVFTAVFGRWYPSLDLSNHRTAARQLHTDFPEARFCFYGKNLSYPLVYNLRRIVPRVQTLEELQSLLARDPGRVVIAQTKNKVAPPALPEGLVERERIDLDRQTTLRIYANP